MKHQNKNLQKLIIYLTKIKNEKIMKKDKSTKKK